MEERACTMSHSFGQQCGRPPQVSMEAFSHELNGSTAHELHCMIVGSLSNIVVLPYWFFFAEYQAELAPLSSRASREVRGRGSTSQMNDVTHDAFLGKCLDRPEPLLFTRKTSMGSHRTMRVGDAVWGRRSVPIKRMVLAIYLSPSETFATI